MPNHVFARHVLSTPHGATAAAINIQKAGAQMAARVAFIEINRPLTSLTLSNPLTGAFTSGLAGSGQDLAGGGVAIGQNLVSAVVSLPIGMDIKSITCTASDAESNWLLLSLNFGTLQLVNPQGTASNGLNLSMFDPRLSREDRLAPWILSKTKVDVQAQYSVLNGNYVTDPATGTLHACKAIFGGFSLNAFQEEQVCAIQTRVEPTNRAPLAQDTLNVLVESSKGALSFPSQSQMGSSQISTVSQGPMSYAGVIGGAKAPLKTLY